MNRSLLDTDIFSEVLKNKDARVRDQAMQYRKLFGRYSISALTVTEIIAGFSKANSPRELAAFRAALGGVEVLPLGRDAADLAGEILGALARTGQPIGATDPLIAAVAISNNLVLVTGNTKHFERVQALGFQLQLANWRVE
ncbi:PIN domain-containing protein [Bythopirellula polymerisocia]|uniref:Ribonuclease VapC n=1 Tax=Bythopirellula polymerisocia TaxID=2528003 RepID=A0A5C6D246_9BACT|nr:PIN domain-containing protein [Bythopirellula polymerisocia]TWU29851.1 tRNA(fMet)-specific endonuclease VapC [Bythopirellula polymerisocia]